MTKAAAIQKQRETSIITDRRIPFVDTHHHLWELSRLPYDWLTNPSDDSPMGDYSAICRDWGPERFFREFYAQNVTKSIHVEAGYSGPDPVDETRWLDEVSKEYGFPNGLIVRCDSLSRGGSEELERHINASPLVRGIRDPGWLQHQDHENSYLRATCASLEALDLVYEVAASPGSLNGVAVLAQAFPALQVVLEHAGFPLRRDPEYFQLWRNEMRLAAGAPNVVCKVSGLPSVDHNWSANSLRPWVMACIELFGPDRVMFGTNWPVDSLFSPYVELVDAWRRIVAESGMAVSDTAKLLHQNAERIYRI